jgi:hypothetical protein
MPKSIPSFKSFKRNEREIVVLNTSSKIRPLSTSGEITSLKFEEFLFSVGEVWKIKDSPYLISSIKEEVNEFGNTNFILQVVPQTKSTIFILPMLGGKRQDYLFDKNFINCYLADEVSFKDYSKIILSYRFSGHSSFDMFEKTVSAHPYYEAEYEPDGYHVNYVFSIPKEYEEDYKLFIDGRYSEFSDDYKKQILKFHSFKKDGSTGGILYKSKERREVVLESLYDRADRNQFPADAELYSRPKLHEETFLSKYIIPKQKNLANGFDTIL